MTPGHKGRTGPAHEGRPDSVGSPDQASSEGRSVEHSLRVPGSRERVWNAWTDPALIAGWFVERAVGRPETGGRVTWAWDRFGVEAEQEVIAADAPERLVLRSRQPTGDVTVLEVTLTSHGGEGDETVVRIVQSGFGGGGRGDAAREGARTGWMLALGILRRYSERWYGRSKTEALVLRPVGAGTDAVAALYGNPEEVARWLRLEENRAPAPVLVDAGHEQLRAWDEIDGTLELKAFPSADGGCTVGLRALSWSLLQQQMDVLEQTLATSVESLVQLLE